MNKSRTLVKKMKSPLERGILKRRLFGELIIKQGTLYIEQDANYFPRSYNFRNLMREADTQAKLIGMKPLRLEDVCSDFIKAIENAGIFSGLKYNVGLTDEDFKDKKQRDKYMQDKKRGNYLYWDLPLLSPTTRQKLYSSSISLLDSTEVFSIENFFSIGSYGDYMRILPKVDELNGVSTSFILSAYRMNIKKMSLTPFEKSYREILTRIEEGRERNMAIRDERYRRQELLAEHLRKVERKKPAIISVGEKEDMDAKITELSEKLRTQKIEFEERLRNSYNSGVSQRISVSIGFGYN
jgi:hypothetical protein